MGHLLKYKKIAGVSLLEVVAVLMLSSVLLIAAARMTTSLLYQIKAGEVEDYVTGLVVRALEVAKTPVDVRVDSNPLPSGTFYKLNIGSNLFNLVGYGAAPNITSCNSSSPYFTNSTDVSAFKQVPVCIQLVVRRLTNQYSDSYYYDIAVRAVYELPGRVDTLDAKGYRYADFQMDLPPEPNPCELEWPPTC